MGIKLGTICTLILLIISATLKGQVIDKGRKIEREIRIEKRYLNFPVGGGEKIYGGVTVDGKLFREFDIRIEEKDPEWWAYLDVSLLKGKTINLWIYSADKKAISMIMQTDEIVGHETLYREPQRPQLHLTAKRGWINDCAGMVYFKGEYHLFTLRNPYFSSGWSNTSWAHMVSSDLAQWEELGDHILPDENGLIFTGSAVIDWKNTAGFQKGNEPPIVSFYTNAGTIDYPSNKSWYSKSKKYTQSIAYSNNLGRSWKKYELNPIVGHISGNNRDPKVIWYDYHETDQAINDTAKELGGHWVMIVYIEPKNYMFLTSTNLKDWERVGTLESFDECPELFELKIENPQPGQEKSKWIHYGGSGVCITGEFDGKMFIPDRDAPNHRISHGPGFYASQSFNDVPIFDGRRIIVGWIRKNFNGTSWNQMLSIPIVVSLRSLEDGLRLFVNPPEELELLREDKKRDFVFETNSTLALDDIEWPLLEIDIEIDLAHATGAGITIRGLNISYENGYLDVGGTKTPVPLLQNKEFKLQIFVDNGFVDVFANDGYSFIPLSANFDLNKPIEVQSTGGKCAFKITVHKLGSIWKSKTGVVERRTFK